MTEDEWQSRVVRLAVRLHEAMREYEDYKRLAQREDRDRYGLQYEFTSTLAHLRELVEKRPKTDDGTMEGS